MTQPHFLAFVKDTKTLGTLKDIAEENGWPENVVKAGGIDKAILTLADKPSPRFLLVEISSTEEAPEELDKLADVCDADTNVIVTSKVDEFSFYSWLKDIGIHEYLLQPITKESLQQALIIKNNKDDLDSENEEKPQIIAFIGARGGVGTTTIISNLAYLLSRERKQKTALLDLDTHNGSVAMCFDIESGRGLHGLLETPERIDALFVDRVITKYSDTLSILGSETSLIEDEYDQPEAIESILHELKAANQYILADLPRNLNNNTRKIVELADHIVIATELSTLGLRDTTRLRDLIVEEMHKPEPLIIANKVGMMGNDEVKPTDFIRYYGHEIEVEIPYLKEAFTSMATGEMLYDICKTPIFKRAMNILANNFSEAEINTKQKSSGLFSKLIKRK